MSSNQEYKSDVFSMLMENPQNSMSVYNALNHSNYRDTSLIQVYKLENGIRLSVRNDASFIIDSYLNLYEHQSRYNPNMPLRFLIYATDLFKRLVKNKDLLSTSIRKIPTPKFAVFYNGVEERPEIEHMRLSDAFQNPTDAPELELKCTVYNINPNHNRELMEQCDVLREYTAFVERVREYEKSYPLEHALDLAIKNCISDHILEEFLLENWAEVKRVSMLDYTFERRMQLAEDESREIIEQLTNEKKNLVTENSQLTIQNDQLATKNDQLTTQNDQLIAEIDRMRKLLAEHGIEEK